MLSGMAASISGKVKENRVRRMAQRQGLALVKSRHRDPWATNYGTYGLIDPDTDAWVAHSGRSGYGMELDEVEAWLTEPAKRYDTRKAPTPP
jgi:hypothetical protein